MDEPKASPVTTFEFIVVVTTVSLLCLFLVLGSISNVVLILAFNRRPALRSISNRFVGNLLVVNLFSAVILIPFVCANLFMFIDTGNQPYVSSQSCGFQCFLQEFSSSSIAAVSLLSTLLIALDQYLAIMYPLRYHHLLTSFRAWILISVAWSMSLIVGLIKVVGTALSASFIDNPERSGSFNNTNVETIAGHDSVFGISHIVSLSIFVSVFVLPSILLAFIYGRIYIEAHKNLVRIRREKLNPVRTMLNTAIRITDRMGDPNKKRIKKRRSKRSPSTLNPDNNTEQVQSDGSLDEFTPLRGNTPNLPRHPAPGSLERSRTIGCLLNPRTPSPRSKTRHPLKRSHSQQLMNSIRHKLSNASQFIHRYKEEMHTARVSFISVILVLICWLPYYVVGLFWDNGSTGVGDSDQLWIVCFVDVMIALYTVLSPCVFSYRCKRLQREVSRLFTAFYRSESRDLPFHNRFPLLRRSNANGDLRNASLHRRDTFRTNPPTSHTPSLILTVPPELNDQSATSSLRKKINKCLSMQRLSLATDSASQKFSPTNNNPSYVAKNGSQRSSISSASGQSAGTAKNKSSCLNLPNASSIKSQPVTRDDSQRSSVSSASNQSTMTNLTTMSERGKFHLSPATSILRQNSNVKMNSRNIKSLSSGEDVIDHLHPLVPTNLRRASVDVVRHENAKLDTKVTTKSKVSAPVDVHHFEPTNQINANNQTIESKASLNPNQETLPSSIYGVTVPLLVDVSPRRLAMLARSQSDGKSPSQRPTNAKRYLSLPKTSGGISYLSNRSLQNLSSIVKEGAQLSCRFVKNTSTDSVNPNKSNLELADPDTLTREIRIEISQA